MAENEAFWEFYWEVRLQSMETLGKREAILAISRLVRALAARGQPARMLELGCGEGQIIGALSEAHAQAPGISASVGVDYVRASVEKCRRDYPGMTFLEGDFTDAGLLARLGNFAIVLLVNALHEVFSATFSPELGEVDVPAAKLRVAQALESAAERVAPGGYLVLFDGIEPPGSPQDRLRVRFASRQARAQFEVFAREFRPFKITWREERDPLVVELSRRDFARYIDKSIFLGKKLWETERLESYQYFTESEFRAAFERLGLAIQTLRTLTVNDEKWLRAVEIETPGEAFPAEHVLIIAQKKLTV